MTLRVLTITTLFPNSAQPHHGVFVRNRLAAQMAEGGIAPTVVAPVGWVPKLGAELTGKAALRTIPAHETWEGVEILHPRYPIIPKIGMSIAPLLLYPALHRTMTRLRDAGRAFDLIDAHYFYPDGVAAAWLAATFDLPVCITARGSDLTLLPNFAAPRFMIKRAAENADGLVTVSADLKQCLADLGIAKDRVKVLSNGVDLDMYRPRSKQVIRADLGLDSTRRIIGSVGHLIERKGHDLVIETLQGMPDVDLAIVGDGPERRRLGNLAQSLGVDDRVHFLGARPPAELAAIYSAFDLLVLASSREGWANVLLEAMACDVPVVATAVGGTPEVITASAAGLLVEERTAASLRSAIQRLLEHPPEAGATRRFAENHSWTATAQGLKSLFHQICATRRRRR